MWLKGQENEYKQVRIIKEKRPQGFCVDKE